jgi:hypothetical protein
MPPPGQANRPPGANGQAASGSGKDLAAEHSPSNPPAQLLHDLGHRLSVQRSPMLGQPTLVRSWWHRCAAAERWREAAS